MSGSPAIRVFGIIPAAGRSRRMGQPKQLLAFGRSTVLETVIDTVLDADLDGLVVVTHPQINKALHLTEDERHMTAILDDPEAEMIESILLAVDAIARHHHPHDGDAFLVCPADIPAMTRELVARCAEEYRTTPHSIVVGALGERNGHPIVVPFELRYVCEGLRGVGLKRILTSHANLVRRVQAASPDAIRDIDTRDDYESLRP